MTKLIDLKKLLEVDKIQEKGIELLCAAAGWAYSNFVRADSVDSELVSLRDRARRIKAALEDAEQRRYIEDRAVLLRLRELRAVAFDIEDLLDEFETRKSAYVPTGSLWLWYCYRVTKVIDDIEARYQGIVKENRDIPLKPNEAVIRRLTSVPLLPEAGSQLGALKVHGRDEKIGEIIELLSRPSPREENIQVIAIKGVGGIGKTALAQRVFEETKSKGMFEKWIWVNLSQQFDAKGTIREIITSLNNGEECRPSSSLDLLQIRLKSLLVKSKFLLVLDNVWNEDSHFWDALRIPLSGNPWSKILMTTRNNQAAQKMQARVGIDLDKLDVYSTWLVLRDQAFAPGEQDGYEDLVSIGMEIAAKCDGSPLAAQLLGRTLSNSTSREDWQAMSDEMPDPREVVGQILPIIMRVSYDPLPLHLKHCLAYCSIFPRGYEFDRDEIVKLWMAEGLIEYGRASESFQIEDAGNRHFKELLERSFFRPSSSSSSRENKQKYQMPSFVHDLAESVSKYECLSVNALGFQHGIKDGESARYAFLSYPTEQQENLDLICKNKSLRTLLLHNEHGMTVTRVPSSLLELMRLRVLDMSYSKLKMLPDSVGNLIHLRHLGLRATSLETLPKTIKKLHNLQTLELGECYNLKELPTEICSLIKLRHLGLHLDWENWDEIVDRLTSTPPGIGKLTNLQTLSRFSVASDENCGIDQLGRLNLRGELCISKLENVAGGQEAASKANLSQKRKIEFLMLCWSKDASSKRTRVDSAANDVANGLQPHTNLKSLWIDNYTGTRFPGWMEDPAYAYLETLRLTSAGSCEILPCVAGLPRLKNLYIKGLHKVKEIPSSVPSEDNSGTGFPSLEVLCVSDVEELEALFATHDDRNISSLPRSLRKLELRNCPRLIIDPSTSAPSLQELVICGVNWGIVSWLPQLVSLRSLAIMKIPGLTHILTRFTRNLNNLQTLKIENCIELKSLAAGADGSNLRSLRNMEISKCPKLHSLPALRRTGGCNITLSECLLLEQFCQRRGINYVRKEDTNQN